MVEVRTIPLGGTDYAGNQLPPQGQFYVPGGQEAAQGEVAAGGWAPFTPKQPAPDANMQAGPQATQPDQGGASGGWAPYQPNETPPREIGQGEAALRGAAHGLTFGFYPAIAGAVSGAKAALTGEGDFSSAYEKTRQEEEQAQTQAEKQNPATFIASDIAANIPTLFVPGLGMGKAAAVGAEALPRIGQAIRTGAIAGGLFGAGEQTSKGASPLEIAEGAGGGALAGGTLGGVLGSGVEGASKVGQRVASIVRGNKDADLEAQRLALGAFKQDENQVRKVASDRPALQAAQDAGLDVRLADVGGGNTKALLRTSANIAPEARDIIGETVGPRFQQQGTRIGRFIRSRFGSDRSADIDALKAAADKANDPAYAAAYRAGARMPLTKELQELLGAPSIQEAVLGALKPMKDRGIIAGYKLPRRNPFYLNPKTRRLELAPDEKGNTVLPELAYWDQITRNLQGRIGELLRSGNNTRARDLIQLKNRLTDELDNLVPQYKAAREGAARFFRARDASEAGANFVTDTSISDREALKVLAKMSPAERELFKRGFASELADKVERTGFNSSVLNSIFLNNGPAKRRILIALGPDNAGQLEALLRAEGIVDRTRRALGNSTTIQQGADAGKFGTTLATIEGLKGAFNPVYLIAIPLIWAGRQTAKQVDERVFTKVAELLMSDDPAKLARGLDLAAKNPTIRTALRYASDLSARQLVNLLGPSGVAAGAATLGGHFMKSNETRRELPEDYYENQGQQIAPP